jgi:hypothetical protein
MGGSAIKTLCSYVTIIIIYLQKFKNFFLSNKNVSPKMNGKFIFEELSMQNTK